MDKKILISVLCILLIVIIGCSQDIKEIEEQPEQKDFFLQWELHHLDCFGPNNLCNRVYLNTQDFNLFIHNGPDITLDLKGRIEAEKVPQIKNILLQLSEKEEQIKNTPDCGDTKAGTFNLTFYLDKTYSFSKLYCVRSEEEAPWFGQITYLEHLFHLEATQFGIPLASNE
ncbi:hypothetical protein GF371_04925 [Candidatus Woesearchaeota archaeon]|nr:hypothetical protein [Candidatus Woesearchaeota archaeon]